MRNQIAIGKLSCLPSMIELESRISFVQSMTLLVDQCRIVLFNSNSLLRLYGPGFGLEGVNKILFTIHVNLLGM